MFVAIVSILVGIVGVYWGAERFVAGGVATATRLGVSKFVIGLTVIALGTSAPEIWVSASASILPPREPEIAVGNALGSNIANIGLVLGVAALIKPIAFTRDTLRIEMPFLIGVTAIGIGLVANMWLGRWDGAILLGLFLLYLLYVGLYKARRPDAAEGGDAEADAQGAPMSLVRALVWTAVGLAVLQSASYLLIFGASGFATELGVSDLFIGLTIVAVGTSLPELAVTVRAVRANHGGLALGNVIGSNILNLLLVLAIPALIAPTALGEFNLLRDGGALAILTAAMYLFAVASRSRRSRAVGRLSGALLLGGWIAYMTLLIVQSSQTI